MKFQLYRKENTDSYCHGRLYVSAYTPDDGCSSAGDAYFLCDTLEPPVRPSGQFVPGKTAVPAGTYDVALTRSPRFGRLLPILIDVPGRSGIRIHRGNTVDDTKGCILPGRYIGRGRLASSTARELDIVRLMLDNDDPTQMEIVDDFGVASATNVPMPTHSRLAEMAAAATSEDECEEKKRIMQPAAESCKEQRVTKLDINDNMCHDEEDDVESDRGPFATTTPLLQLISDEIWKRAKMIAA